MPLNEVTSALGVRHRIKNNQSFLLEKHTDTPHSSLFTPHCSATELQS